MDHGIASEQPRLPQRYSCLKDYTQQSPPPTPYADPPLENPCGHHSPHCDLFSDDFVNFHTGWRKNEDIINCGLTPATGRFTEEEKKALISALMEYQIHEGISDEELEEIIGGRAKHRYTEFWLQINAAVPARTTQTVYAVVRAMYTPVEAGPWQVQEDVLLEKAMEQYGNNWVMVSRLVGRSPQACRCRNRDQLERKKQLALTGIPKS
ncbi:hypothetical protein HWV62_18812 [Athelia sp. TMB]|nr:hypothetical protein HWV62_18812 [Athelia sp. TMB]